MDFVIQPLGSGIAILELNHDSTNDKCVVNTVTQCGCIHNEVQGCSCPQT